MTTLRDRQHEPLALHPMNAWRTIDDHVFVLTEADEFLTINDPVGFEVWQLLDEGPKSVQALVATLLDRFEVEAEVVTADLLEFLDTLLAQGAVAFAADLKA